MYKLIDINCDMGEQRGDDKLIIKYVSSANIACGGHAGTAETIRETIVLAQSYKVAAGAHPGYEDRENFGREELNLKLPEIVTSVLKQISWFKTAADSIDYPISHIKLHGALYNRASADYELMVNLTSAVINKFGNLPFFVLAGSRAEEAVADTGGRFFSEAFADRAYDSQGQLVSRLIEGSVLRNNEEIAKRVLKIAKKGEVESVTGKMIKLKADTICIHGDTLGSVGMAQIINRILKENKFTVRSCNEV